MPPRPATVAALVLLAGPALGQPAFKAGFAERDITPAVGSEQPGNYGKQFHKSLHDPCKVRAAVFDDGSAAVAVVGLDALAIDAGSVAAARKLITDRTKMPPSAVLVGASHSHSSGPTAMVLPGEYDHAPDAVKQLATEHSSCADPKYLARVVEAIADAVTAAYDGRRPARAAVGRGEERTVAFNRRFVMRDGRTVTHPRPGNPDIVEPAGPIDPEVGVVGAWDDKGKLMGCVVNFSCHATTSPGGISANYVYYLERVIQGYFGKDVPVVFVNGASADVTQVDNRSPYRAPNAEQVAQLVGGRVGAEALRVLFVLEPTAGNLVPVAAKNVILTIPRRRPSAEHLAAAKERTKSPPPGGSRADTTDWTFAKETVLLDAKIQKVPAAAAEVQAIQVGPAVFLTTPAEYFCKFGLEQKAASGFPFTFPVSLANGCVGYVPTADAFGPTGGGYETRLTSYSNLEVSAGAKLRDAGVALAKQLTPGAVPTPPKAPPFSGNGWAYGVNPPGLD